MTRYLQPVEQSGFGEDIRSRADRGQQSAACVHRLQPLDFGGIGIAGWLVDGSVHVADDYRIGASNLADTRMRFDQHVTGTTKRFGRSGDNSDVEQGVARHAGCQVRVGDADRGQNVEQAVEYRRRRLRSRQQADGCPFVFIAHGRQG